MPVTLLTIKTDEEKTAFTAALARSAPKARHRLWWHAALEFAALSCLTLAAVEVVFHIAGVGEEEFVQPDTLLGCVHIPDKMVTWRLEGYSHEPISHQGHRDTEHTLTKNAGVTRIALLGDSTTEALQVPLTQTYGKVLERLLNDEAVAKGNGKKYEVLNFGCASYSTGQELLCYEEQVRQYKPDVVVLMYNRGDSSENVIAPEPADQLMPRPYFHLDDSSNLVIDRSIINIDASQFKPNPILSFLRRYSCIYGVIAHENLMLSINEPSYAKLRRSWMRLPGSGFSRQATRWFKPAYPTADSGVVTAALLKRLRQEVESDNAKLSLLIFNDCREPGFALERKHLLELKKTENFDLLDLTQSFSNDSGRKSLLLQNHLSGTGHGLVAKALCEQLTR